MKKYEFNYDIITAQGIKVDTGGQDVDFDLLDKMTNEVQKCLLKTFGRNGKIPTRIQKEAYCSEIEFDPKIKKECLNIKIPTNWIWSNTQYNMQLLNDNAPFEGCARKGQKKEDGPCKWRAGISDSNIIVVTPNLYLYKDPLVKLITSCMGPWENKELSNCMLNKENTDD